MDTGAATLTDLRDSIEFIRRHEKELRLFNVDPADALHENLRTYFKTLNVRITAERTASGSPEDVAVLSNATEVLAVVKAATLRELLEDVPTGDGELGIADAEYEGILRYLKETTFTSYDTEQLLYASREIEDRARRIGQGSIHAGFQQCSVMAEQQPVYSDLARRGVSVHAYGVPDVMPPELGSAHVHPIPTDEIAETWFVVFDGGGDDTQKSALLAHQRDENAFYGLWTYDPGFVNHILGYLNRTYDSPSDDVLSGL
ncbi:DICT sensory domain-containing protein [Haloarcula sp. GH36]|uniref:DICT sensory domain-containing protein n=1 Tax=Haloarcula montana TaxID=3111776 RepID=UPI002D7787E6|nr:DICT sensory domain-containing protein [Haloarcula sp. GH36]